MRKDRATVLVLVLGQVLAGGCARVRSPEGSPSPGPSAPGEVLGTGTLESEQAVGLSFRATGRLASLSADQGDRVAAGQLLGTLDADEARLHLELESAGHVLSATAVAKAAAEVEQLEASRLLAAKDLDRIRDLAGSGVVSQAALDDAEARAAEATARLQAARAAREVAERAVVQAERAVAVRRVALADQKLRSPVEGLILRRHREVGDVLAAGMPVLSLVSTRKLWLRACVDETALASLREGQEARIVFRSEPGRSYRGRVDRVGPESDRETHELLVDVEVLERPARLAIGQRGDVYLKVAP